ncbi:hypothetical protein M8818_006116 [Zalaria obscura]|uniref:Uncharacterized protein n=1 Tax=Zalaria obscura TaxID=2024903 RepID=A0ACC3S7Y8_9PEZI
MAVPMFDLPEAKRVRRSDLDSPQSSRSSSPDSAVLDRLRASAQYDFVTVADPVSADKIEQDDGEEEELEFRLFAPTTTTAQDEKPAQVIRLRSPSLEATDPGFLNPLRDHSYYFTDDKDTAKTEEYAIAAVAGEDLLSRSHSHWPGCTYAWKVISIPASQAKTALTTSDVLTPASATFLPDAERKRTRLGKQGRIRKREKAAAAKAKKEEEAKSKEEKERAEREKRAKRNREKKFKKRARDKAKKAAGGGDAITANEDGADSASEAESAE